jgi:hypothetical protein
MPWFCSAFGRLGKALRLTMLDFVALNPTYMSICTGCKLIYLNRLYAFR